MRRGRMSKRRGKPLLQVRWDREKIDALQKAAERLGYADRSELVRAQLEPLLETSDAA